ncbi:hypothetical protein SAMN05444277_106234 [Parafilimonas terrae]|uniref:Uncharacterized protein n=2 Tax=Parafilimonas terrae TaxID=1465490 RepID=A0A1I5WJY0_9BACT|nr:hypothetical protein SAMN05444277_106234 [Parafilimonas terrae]
MAFLYGVQIFLLLAFMHQTDRVLQKYKFPVVLRMALPEDGPDTSYFGRRFSGEGFLNEAKRQRKKITTIYLTGIPAEDIKRFDLVKYESRKIEYTHDTMNIIKVHFNENCTYGQFVNLVNIMVEDKHKRYMYYKDDFYIIKNPIIETVSNNVKMLYL